MASQLVSNMWRAPLGFMTLHYAYIILMGILSLPIMYSFGNISAIDAYFMGCSASTESGLTSVNLTQLPLYQQLYLYVTPMITNMGFVNIVVVVVRLHWFNKRIDKAGHALLQARRRRVSNNDDVNDASLDLESGRQTPSEKQQALPVEKQTTADSGGDSSSATCVESRTEQIGESKLQQDMNIDSRDYTDSDATQPPTPKDQEKSSSNQPTPLEPLAQCKSGVARLSRRDREEIGGIEYKALQVLLKVITGMWRKPPLTTKPPLKLNENLRLTRVAYFFGMHLFGGLGLLIWINCANAKYRLYLDQVSQNKNWWAFYTSQSLMDNLGFTLTADNMVQFRDSVWPLLLLSFVALAGETLYPVFLRFIIWAMAKLARHDSPSRPPLLYLLNHPRRCYTLLFPGGTTWALFGIISALNVIDTILIVVLDLHNSEVAGLALGNRFVAAFFQAVASRHAGTTPYNLANVSPAVQFSLLVMMYISIYPVAISIRTSNVYEEGSVGVYAPKKDYDENRGGKYLIQHLQQQLSFDIWYIFLGIFLLAVTEGPRVADLNEPHIKIFPIFFEVVSAYANVGISLGHPSVTSALSAKFSLPGKLVVCAMMIRGRHRGMPHRLDRAIVLPDERSVQEASDDPS